MEASELQREKLGRLPERRGSAGAWGGKSKTATGSRAQCARDRTQAGQGTEGLRLSSAVGADGILRVDALPLVLVTLATAVRIAPYFIFQSTRPIAREDRYSMDPFPLADCAMPNIGSLLKSEISRLARREVRQETQPLRKAGAGYRREIAALKRKIAALQRQANQFAKARSSFAAGETPSSQSPTRFVAKGLRAAAITLGQLVSNAKIDESAGALALSLAFTTNSIVKCVLAAAGGIAYARPVVGGIALINMVLLGVLWLW